MQAEQGFPGVTLIPQDREGEPNQRHQALTYLQDGLVVRGSDTGLGSLARLSSAPEDYSTQYQLD